VRAIDFENKKSKRNESRAAEEVIQRAINKLAYLKRHGIQHKQIDEIVVEYFKMRKHTILKNHNKKYMISLLLGDKQCPICRRWFAHESNLT
jgi:hypothetical protein